MEIMSFPFPISSTNNWASRLIYNDLRFKGVSFFLATIEAFLCFLGRSIGLSVTSTTTSIAWSDSSSFFLPGRLNFLTESECLLLCGWCGRLWIRKLPMSEQYESMYDTPANILGSLILDLQDSVYTGCPSCNCCLAVRNTPTICLKVSDCTPDSLLNSTGLRCLTRS